MCGIIAVLRRPTAWEAPPAGPIVGGLDAQVGALAWAAERFGPDQASLDRLAAVADHLEGIDARLRGTAGVACLLAGPGSAVADAVADRSAALDEAVRAIEAGLDAHQGPWPAAALEAVNALLVRLKDVVWALGRDRVDSARAIADLLGADAATGVVQRAGDPADGEPGRAGAAALDAFWAIQCALSSLDRLEVRGRDSAGVHVLVSGHDLDLAAPDREPDGRRLFHLHGRADPSR
jgi:glutamine---fructose-6-phosphate transaminase (isomerizing)